MKVMKPFGADIDLDRGVMAKAKNHLVRRASDMRGHYRDAAAQEPLIADGDPVRYELVEVPVPETAGHNRGDIENEGFPERAFRRGRRIVIERPQNKGAQR